LAKLEVEILTVNWPKLTIVAKATDDNGISKVLQNKVPYDQAYSQFENDLHNLLRPLVDTTIQKRKGR